MKESLNMPTPSPESESKESEKKFIKIGPKAKAMMLMNIGLNAFRAFAGQAEDLPDKGYGDMNLEQGGDKGHVLTIDNLKNMTFDDIVKNLDAGGSGDGPDPEMPEVDVNDVELTEGNTEGGEIGRRGLEDINIDLGDVRVVDEGDHYTIEVDMERLMAADDIELEKRGNVNVEDPNEKFLREVEAKEAATQEELKKNSEDLASSQ